MELNKIKYFNFTHSFKMGNSSSDFSLCVKTIPKVLFSLKKSMSENLVRYEKLAWEKHLVLKSS